MRRTITIAALGCSLLAIAACKQENNYPAADTAVVAIPAESSTTTVVPVPGPTSTAVVAVPVPGPTVTTTATPTPTATAMEVASTGAPAAARRLHGASARVAHSPSPKSCHTAGSAP